jgi:hypothetical protein
MRFPFHLSDTKGILFRYEIEKFPDDGGVKNKRITIGFPLGLAFLLFLILHFLLK